MTTIPTTRIAALAGLVLLVACGQDPTPPAATVDTILITPAASGVVIGQTLQLTAKVYDASGHVLADRPVTWTSSAPAQASVSSTGFVTGLAMSDSVVITARSEGKSATTTLAVVMDISGEWTFTQTIEVWWFVTGNPNQGVATVAATCNDTGSYRLSQSGAEISGTMWQVGECIGHPSLDVPVGSANNTVLSLTIEDSHLSATHMTFGIVGDNCVFTADLTGPPPSKAVGTYECPFNGRIWIKGTWEATPGGAPVSVVAVRWDAHPVSGGVVQLVSVPRDASGHVLSRPVTWSSDNPSVATVSDQGLVAARGPGSARITATSETVAGSAVITADRLSLRSVSVGTHGCGLTDGGAAYCWGYGPNGELGLGYRPLAETVAGVATPRAVAGGQSFAAVSAGIRHSCAVTPSHVAYCWGDNAQGQLGDGSTTSSLAPVLVTGGHQFASVSVGVAHSCGLTTANKVYCWGNNDGGQLARAGGASQVPVVVGGDTLLFQTLRSGLYHNCAITLTHQAYCWGFNGSGQIGDGTTVGVVRAPSAVQGGHSFVPVGAGFAHSCGIATDGTAYCWGDGTLIGDGSFNGTSSLPRPVTGGPFATVDSALSAGQENTCALTVTGAAYCWGHNSLGELGDGSKTDRTTPVPVSGGLTFASLSVGVFVTCGVGSAAVVYCWGDNADGRAGVNAPQSCVINGTNLPCATTPVPVIGQSGAAAAISLQIAPQTPGTTPPLTLPTRVGEEVFARAVRSFRAQAP